MVRVRVISLSVVICATVSVVCAAEHSDIERMLSRPILEPNTTVAEMQNFCESRVPPVPEAKSVKDWETQAAKMRAEMLDRIVFRGEAKAWRDAPLKVEWLDTIPGGPGYSIRKLRYEAMPGLWVPALLYVPEKLDGRVPVVLNVNGHVGAEGKAIGYKQLICINQAKRGMLALNIEWLGMGQLSGVKYNHNRLNQLDLCGTSGLAPFNLLMTRALDVLLAHPNADPKRVAVTGLSGGGWQTIVIASLDPRVTLAVPVAGYSSLRTRARHLTDLGDAEQTPSDMVLVADYAHLTAMLAPRPTLLIYNLKDECCFASGHALGPLMDAAGPAFELYGKRESLRSHVNESPGTHNYEKDNREAFYRMVGDHFFAGDAKYPREEIASEMELKSEQDLRVEIPAGPKVTFNSLAHALAKDLPRESNASTQAERRAKLREIVRFRDYRLNPEKRDTQDTGGVTATRWRLTSGSDWTIPVVELTRRGTDPKATSVLIDDGGRARTSKAVARLLDAGDRVIAVDLFSFGEANLGDRAYLLALLVAAVGERPLGIEASQLAAVARWQKQVSGKPVTIIASGPRSSLCALVAAALETEAVGGVELHGAMGSLKELIEKDRSVDEMPDMFCFGLLEWFDVPQLVALCSPRPVRRVQ